MERQAGPHTAPQGHAGLQPLHSCPALRDKSCAGSPGPLRMHTKPVRQAGWSQPRSLLGHSSQHDTSKGHSLYHGFAP